MKLISWNVNGLRAAVKKGFANQFATLDADIFCLQETKLQQGQIDLPLPGYRQYWSYAEKKGYAGTAIFTKRAPLAVTYGLGDPALDGEGRIITLEFPQFYCVTCYTPNAQDGLRRLDFRMQWDDAFRAHLSVLDAKKPVVACGDLNVAHRGDRPQKPGYRTVATPDFPTKSAPSLHALLEAGFTDTFRYQNPEPDRRVLLVELSLPRPGEECRVAHRLFPDLRPAAPGAAAGGHFAGYHGFRSLPGTNHTG